MAHLRAGAACSLFRQDFRCDVLRPSSWRFLERVVYPRYTDEYTRAGGIDSTQHWPRPRCSFTYALCHACDYGSGNNHDGIAAAPIVWIPAKEVARERIKQRE